MTDKDLLLINGELKSKIVAVRNRCRSGGISDPLGVIEQITHLLFLRRLDDLRTTAEKKARGVSGRMMLERSRNGERTRCSDSGNSARKGHAQAPDRQYPRLRSCSRARSRSCRSSRRSATSLELFLIDPARCVAQEQPPMVPTGEVSSAVEAAAAARCSPSRDVGAVEPNR